MQLSRLSHLVFPQSAAPPVAAPLASSVEEHGAGTGIAKGQTQGDAPATGHSPGVLYSGIAASADAAGNEAAPDIAAMSLEQLITLGKSKGVFNHITYSRNGTFGQGPASENTAPPVDFVSSAVNIMRDFQEGMAALKTEAPEVPMAKPHLWESGFKSLRQAVGRLNAVA